MRLFKAENALAISDLQIPFEHPHALTFCKQLKKEFKISDDLVFNVGDETDQYFGGMYTRDINGDHTANSELKLSIERLKEWYSAFPKMKLCVSNHGTRWMRKAFEAEIPTFMLKKYERVIEAPRGWRWQKHWHSKTKCPFIIEHLDDYGGQYPHVEAAMHNGVSTAGGHHHSIAGIHHVKTNGLDIWGASTGSLIDFDKYAFNYARNAKKKPQIGALVVLDSGRMPLWVPL